MLIAALALALPSYAGCSHRARFELLGPLDDEVVPTNTAIWFLEQTSVPEDGRPRIFDLATREEIDSIERTTPLRNGLLIELRPSAELAPSSRYSIEIPGRGSIEVMTDLGRDRFRPPMPVVVESDEAPPLAHCLRSGSIFVHTETSESGTFLVATTVQDGDLAIARDSSLGIPAAEGEHLSLSVLAMDLAGNRSPPSLPMDAGGCRTVARTDAALLALLSIFLLAKRRRR